MAFKRADITSTNAFYWADADLSAYAGDDVGNTPYRLTLTDAASKTAVGYVGAVGAGLALSGTEQVGNPGMETGDPPTGWLKQHASTVLSQSNVVAHGGTYSIKCLNGYDGANANNGTYRMNLTGPAVGTLYYSEGYLHGGGSMDGRSATMKNYDTTFGYTILETKNLTGSWQLYSGYNNWGTIASGSPSVRFIGSAAALNNYYYVDDVSCKAVTEPPATAVHVVSAIGGSTRNWASIDSGFNPNTVTSAVFTLLTGAWIPRVIMVS